MSLLAPGLSARIKGFPNRKPGKLLPFYPGLVAPEWGWFWDSAIAVFPAWENAGLPADLVSGGFATLASGGFGWSGSRLGTVLDFQAGNAADLNASNSQNLDGLGDLSLVSYFLQTASDPTTDRGIFGNQSGSLDSAHLYSAEVSNTWYFRFREGGSTDFIAIDKVDTTKPTLLIGTRSGTNGDVYSYVGGALEATANAVVNSGVLDNTTDLQIGHSPVRYYSHFSFFNSAHNRVLSASERLQLARDPFGPFHTRSLPLFLPSAVDTFDTALLSSSSPRWDRRMRIY